MIVTGVSFTFSIRTLVSCRTLALIGVIPCWVLLIGLLVIPESPRWLTKAGQQKEFELSLRKLPGKDVDISQETADIQVTLKEPGSAKNACEEATPIINIRRLHKVHVVLGGLLPTALNQ